MTNLQEKRLVISRMEVVRPPPAAAIPFSPSAATTSALTATPTTNATAAGAVDSATDGADDTVLWANLPNGPVLYDEKAAGATAGAAEAAAAAAAGAAIVPKAGGGEVALPGAGDSYTCCFTAKGHSEHPAPLGKLRVTWRPEDNAAAATAAATAAVTGRGGYYGPPIVPPSPVFDRAGAAAAAVGEAVTEFPLPVLSARPPALSARLKVPPHARVGVEFSMR